jgi:hypothetical protein
VSEELLKRCGCPAILCSVIGPYISFSVGVHLGQGRYVCDPVTPFLPLLVLRHQQDMMVSVAKALAATKMAVHRLIPHYWDWYSLSAESAAKVQLDFSFVHSFAFEQKQYEFRYLGKLPKETSDLLIFRVVITQVGGPDFQIGQELVVKFSKIYCMNSHLRLAKVGLAICFM